MKTYQKIASTIQARLNCFERSNWEWFGKHEEELDRIGKDVLPSGSGIDSGMKIDIENSTSEKIVIMFGFHHMNDSGSYDGWTEHKAIITPSLAFGFNMKITGRDRNQIKEYLYDVLSNVLAEEMAGA